jgi:uncharacterized protein (DUF58 family)
MEGLLAGDYRSTLLGDGTELAQVRPYVPGDDDVRRIDWNVTARTNVPHVRVHLAERVLVTWLVLTRRLRCSSALRTVERRTSPRASRLRSAMWRRGAATGWALDVRRRYAADAPPRQGRFAARPPSALRDSAADGTRHVVAGDGSTAPQLARQRSAVIVVSDFAGRSTGGVHCWSSPVGTTWSRRDQDPREQELPNAGVLWLVDPETGGSSAPTPATSGCARFAAAAAAERAEVARALASAGARQVVLTTAGDWLRPFAVFLRRGQRR